MIGEIIAIGNELTSGRILNSTSHFAASHLYGAGHEITAMATIGDEPQLIGKALAHPVRFAILILRYLEGWASTEVAALLAFGLSDQRWNAARVDRESYEAHKRLRTSRPIHLLADPT